MKLVVFSAFVMVFAPTISLAGFQIPRGVHTVETIDEAMAEAAKEEKALAFVLSSKDTTCGLCVDASMTAFKDLKSKNVIVYLDIREEKSWEQVSPLVRTGLHDNQIGSMIPRVALTSPDMAQLWVQISKNDLGDERKLREVAKTVDAIQKGEMQPTDSKSMMIHWTLKGTRNRYVGTFEGLKGDKLALKMENDGKVAHIPLNLFTDQTAAFARSLAGLQSKPESADTSALKEPEIEAWTGSNGKVLQARFVNLEGDSVTLQTVDGKSHTMSLTRLAAASQELAKERAGRVQK